MSEYEIWDGDAYDVHRSLAGRIFSDVIVEFESRFYRALIEKIEEFDLDVRADERDRLSGYRELHGEEEQLADDVAVATVPANHEVECPNHGPISGVGGDICCPYGSTILNAYQRGRHAAVAAMRKAWRKHQVSCCECENDYGVLIVAARGDGEQA